MLLSCVGRLTPQMIQAVTALSAYKSKEDPRSQAPSLKRGRGQRVVSHFRGQSQLQLHHNQKVVLLLLSCVLISSICM